MLNKLVYKAISKSIIRKIIYKWKAFKTIIILPGNGPHPEISRGIVKEVNIDR